MAIIGPPIEERYAFYHAYGQAMAGWASLEYELGKLFVSLAKLPPPLGLEIYYSARSFLGRVDMVHACVQHVTDVPPAKRFLADAIAKARAWQAVRNTLAHEMHASVIQQGRDGIFMAISPQQGRYIERPQLEAAAENFFALSQIFRFCPGRARAIRAPELCAEAIALLPTEALQDVGAQTLVGPLLTRIQAHDG